MSAERIAQLPSEIRMMIPAFLALLACELAGDLLRQILALPVPGPVIGMSILAAALLFRGEGSTAKRAITDGLERTAETLIRYMGLLFVPAGVGLINNQLRQQANEVVIASFGQ
jgi:holin-like protein